MAEYEYDLDWLGDGAGTADDPYIIRDFVTLDAMRSDPGAHYVLVRDVEIGTLWEPFDFSGELDGRGHTITGLEVDKTDGSDHYGLFSRLSGRGYVHDLNVITGRTHIRGSSSKYGGVICGTLNDVARIERVMVAGEIYHGGDRGGGIAGYANWRGYLFECAVLVKIVSGGSRSGSIYALDGDVGFNDRAGVYSSEITTDSGTGGAYAINLTVSQLNNPSNYPVEFNFQGKTWEIVDGLPRLTSRPLPGTLVEIGAPGQTSVASGVVQIDSAPAQRTVRAFGYYPTDHDIDGSTVSQSKSLGQATSDPETGAYTIDLLGGYSEPVFVVAFDDYGADFAPDLAVSVGDRIHPTTPNGYVYECIGAGTLPAEEPAWAQDTETAQLYGTASMIAVKFWRPLVHGPLTPQVVEPDPEP